MGKASLLELCHGEKKYETFSISDNNESFLSDSWRKRIERFYFKNRTKAMCVHKTPCRSLFISFVSFSFNSPHVSVSTRTSIRAIGAIRVKKKYSCHSHYYLPSICGPSANLVFKISCSSCERTAANKDS